MEYQNKEKEYWKKKEKKGFKEEKKEGKECPKCHTINALEARFCEECGYDFSGERHCPKCGAKVSPNADICEVCGAWLLEGKCKFCYADLEEGATYCPECGNPVAGIVCPKCGNLSYFDFCKYCNTPLTDRAKKTIEEVKNDPQKKKLLDAFKDYEQGLINSEKANEILRETKDIKFSSNQEARRFFMALRPPEIVEGSEKEKIVTEKEELLKMKAYIEKVDKKERKKKTFTPLFSERQKRSIKEMDKMADEEIKRQEEEKRRQEEERRKRQEEERRRREEEKRRRRPKGWVCNFTGTLHPTPNDCAEPSLGGYWVI